MSVSKVEKLIALARRAGTVHEAAAAWSAAQRLATQAQLCLDEIVTLHSPHKPKRIGDLVVEEAREVEASFHAAGWYADDALGTHAFRYDVDDSTFLAVSEQHGTDIPVRWSEPIVVGRYRDSGGSVSTIGEPKTVDSARAFLARFSSDRGVS